MTLMDQSVSVETGSKRIGDGYLESYAEIPAARVEDPYLAAKKLGGHRRLFDPQNHKNFHEWLIANQSVLEIAYGNDKVEATINSVAAAMLGQQRG